MAAASATAPASSLDTALQMQRREHFLLSNKRSSSASGATSDRLNITLVNQTTYDTVYAYITGLAINNDNAVWLLQSDGMTDYYPTSPSSAGTALTENCAIPLGAIGQSVDVSIPQVAGGRVWFSLNKQMTFLLNPGPGLVEPSVTNPADPNYTLQWDFCEFTYNSSQMFANISYVDFVSVPIALDIAGTDGTTQHVSGMATDGLNKVCKALKKQASRDQSDWGKLIIPDSSGHPLRAISPNNGITLGFAAFSNYFDGYVQEVWSKYASNPLEIDTQASWGVVTGTVDSGYLTFPGGITFKKPTTADIFSCSSGPFATGADPEMNAIIPRLAAGFNRSTILASGDQPGTSSASSYYQTDPTNHYSRICHAHNLDNLGYGFPYDDVAPSNSIGVSGAVASSILKLLTVTVGGNDAYSSPTTAKRRVRRDLGSSMPTRIQASQGYVMESMSDEKAALRSSETMDIERGEKFSGSWEEKGPSALRKAMPPILNRVYDRMAPQLRPLMDSLYLSKVFSIVNSATTSTLSASARAFLSRIILAVFVLLFYMTIELFNKSSEISRKAAPQ